MNSIAPSVVLVVDDDPLLRMVAADHFVDDGYKVIEAGNGAQALLLLDQHPEISILFTDIQMPVLDGLALAKTVHRRRPDILLIITSGQIAPHAEDIPDCGRFLPKPYDHFAVRNAIAQLS